MTATAEALEACHAHLSRAKLHTQRLGQLLHRRGLGDAVATVMLPSTRASLAQSLRDASDAAETVGAEQGDIRWCAPVALIHNASSHVWHVHDPATCGAIADLLDGLRIRIEQLRHRAVGSEVRVRLV